MRNSISPFLIRLTAFAAALLSAGGGAASAQRIENTATIEWTAGQTRVAAPSNRVELQIERPPTGIPTLTTYQLDSSPGATQLSVPQTMCLGSGAPQATALHGVFAGTSLSPASVRETNTIRAGEPLILSVASATDNLF
jgi:hypothetical protein